MRETVTFFAGSVAGFIFCYFLFVEHFAAEIEQRVRTVVQRENNEFFGGVAKIRKDVATTGQGIATKISQESEKL